MLVDRVIKELREAYNIIPKVGVKFKQYEFHSLSLANFVKSELKEKYDIEIIPFTNELRILYLNSSNRIPQSEIVCIIFDLLHDKDAYIHWLVKRINKRIIELARSLNDDQPYNDVMESVEKIIAFNKILKMIRDGKVGEVIVDVKC